MTEAEIKASLAALDAEHLMVTLADAVVARGNGAPMAAMYSLTNLIGAVSYAFTARERVIAADHFRNIADVLERPLLQPKRK